jgi:hypothetical protein
MTSPHGARPRIWLYVLTIAVAAVAFLLVLVVLPQRTWYSGDCGIKYIFTYSLVAHHWSGADLIYPGQSIDPQHRYVVGQFTYDIAGRLYAPFSVTFAYLTSLPYAWFSFLGLYLPSILSLALIVLVTGLLAARVVGPRGQLAAAAITGLATPLLFYGVEFFEHAPAVLLGGLSLLLVLRASEGRRPLWSLAGAGFLTGLAVTLRPEMSVFGLAAAGALLYSRLVPRRPMAQLGALLGGAAVVLGPMLVLNKIYFGYAAGLSVFSNAVSGWGAGRVSAADAIPGLLLPVVMPHAGSLDRILTALVAIALPGLIVVLLREKRGAGRAAGLALAVALIGLIGYRLAQAGKDDLGLTSLLDTFPLVLFLVLALLLRRTGAPAPPEEATAPDPAWRAARFLGAVVVIYVALFLAITPHWGFPAQWGPRLLLMVFPPLAILAVRLYARLARAGYGLAVPVLFWGLVLASVAAQGLGIRMLYLVKSGDARLLTTLAHITKPEEPLVSDYHAFRQRNAALFPHRIFLQIPWSSELPDLEAKLRQTGYRSYWFCFMPEEPGFRPTIIREVRRIAPGRYEAVGASRTYYVLVLSRLSSKASFMEPER